MMAASTKTAGARASATGRGVQKVGKTFAEIYSRSAHVRTVVAGLVAIVGLLVVSAMGGGS